MFSHSRFPYPILLASYSATYTKHNLKELKKCRLVCQNFYYTVWQIKDFSAIQGTSRILHRFLQSPAKDLKDNKPTWIKIHYVPKKFKFVVNLFL